MPIRAIEAKITFDEKPLSAAFGVARAAAAAMPSGAKEVLGLYVAYWRDLGKARTPWDVAQANLAAQQRFLEWSTASR